VNKCVVLSWCAGPSVWAPVGQHRPFNATI
jgi:hypothetical protein